MKKIISILIVLLCLIFQLSVIYFLYATLENYFNFIRIIYSFFCLYFIFKIIKESKSYSFILPWIIIFMILPIPGTIFYISVRLNRRFSRFHKNVINEEEYSKKYLIQDEKLKNKFSDNSSLKYITDFAKYPVTCNNKIDYYPLGDDSYEIMLKELENAKKFIFIEYFIIAPGKFWDSVLEILERKVKEGVEVRIIYDDLGCYTTLPSRYYKKLEKKGIKCIPFNKIRLFRGIIMNNRDHRKILVVDGKVAFSGGINIADEYININSRFGHWKDNCFRLTGDAVWNYTVMFLTLWNAIRKEDEDFTKYKVKSDNKLVNGYVVPYGENPLDDENIGEDIYLNIINNANKYLYIFTPYLIIDSNLVIALILAAKRGVDVRIVIPGIPDKKLVYSVSKSYVDPLLKGGVKVYKYTPGFIHSKVFVSDDIRATVGTLNMDYRSLYLHFECGCYFEKVDVIKDIKKDVDETLKKCDLIKKEDQKMNIFKAFIQSILRLFSPLM